MSCPNISILTILLIHSIFLTFAARNVPQSQTLISTVCSDITAFNLNPKSCVQILQSDRKLSSSKNMFDLSIAIINLGISNATNTHKYLKDLVQTDANDRAALQQCLSSYDLIIKSFWSALGEVELKEYQIATYDLLIGSTDYVEPCKNATDSGRITDQVVLVGVEVVPIYGLSAFFAVSELEKDQV